VKILARRYLIACAAWLGALLLIGFAAWLWITTESSNHWVDWQFVSQQGPFDFWGALVFLLGAAALILLPPAIFVSLDHWRRGRGERAA